MEESLAKYYILVVVSIIFRFLKLRFADLSFYVSSQNKITSIVPNVPMLKTGLCSFSVFYILVHLVNFYLQKKKLFFFT